MTSDKIKVVFIASWMRSGSTILSSMLGQLPTVFNAGEFGFFWEEGLTNNSQCSCGQPFSDCTTWQKIVAAGFSNEAQIDTTALTHHNFFRNINILQFRNLSNPTAELAEKIRLTKQLYQAAQKTTGCDVIIDATKIPAYALFLRQIPDLDVYIIHLVRDPRAVAYSWARKKIKPISAHVSAIRWLYFNFLIEIFLNKPSSKYMFLRYEDFVQSPQKHLERIGNMAGFACHPAAPVQEHTFSGNPGRFENKSLVINPDDEWKNQINRRKNSMVTLIDYSLMKKYGYL